MIHACAHAPGADIGEGTNVWQYASVIRGAKIGRNCNIGSCAIIDGAQIGDRCSIGHGVSLNPGIRLGNDVFVGPNVTFCNDFWPSTSKVGFDLDMFTQGGMVTTIVEDGASIGAGAVILPGTRIGAGALVAAGACVDREVLEDHLFRRDGRQVPIEDKKPRRMRLLVP